MNKVVCIGCKTLQPVPPKVIIYFYNGKSVYNRLCGECQRRQWIECKDLFDSTKDAVNDKSCG